MRSSVCTRNWSACGKRMSGYATNWTPRCARPSAKPAVLARGAHHQRPMPDHVDEEIQVHAPAQCPDCGGPLTVERVELQYQEEIVRRTWVRRFHIPSATVTNVRSACRGDTRCKPPTPSARRRCRW